MNDVAEAPKSVVPNLKNGTTCGACKHGCAVNPDLREPLECRINPPCASGVVMPGPKGFQIVTYTSYPRVQRLGPACGQFAPRFGETH